MTTREVLITVKGVSPYSASRQHYSEKLAKETNDDYEQRTWREKCHYNADGFAVIPAIAFKFAMDSAAKRLAIQVPGRGKQTFTQSFKSGVLSIEDLPTEYTRDDVPLRKQSVNSDGVRGSGKRVLRYFPTVPKWGGTLRMLVVDDLLTKEVFERVLAEAGSLVGVGQYRPENGGTNGRFIVERVNWIEADTKLRRAA
jgi:hypothetical protein